MKLYKKIQFEAAHKLKLPYESKCNSLHGHTYTVEVEIETKPGFKGYMIFDFSNIKTIIKTMDHKFLNDFIEIPTAENIARYLLDKFEEKINKEEIKEVKIKVWETPTSAIEDVRYY